MSELGPNRTCRACGCTEDDPCIVAAEHDELGGADELVGCHWIEFDLCSACVEHQKPPPLLYGPRGEVIATVLTIRCPQCTYVGGSFEPALGGSLTCPSCGFVGRV